MPWSPADADEHAKGLTPHQRQVWANVANDALARCQESGGDDCDATAIRQANAAAKRADEMAESALFAVRKPDDRHDLHVYQPLAFATPPEWAPFLPVPGTYKHPLYGDLDFSPEAYARIVGNFKNGTYQTTIPVNAEHDLSSSGAVGWITDMRIADDGAIDAKVEWNDRGKALIEGDRFRYVSAEVFDVWTDPVTGESIPNVAVGLAICTNPYFKESVLRPLAASEAVLTRVVAPAVVAATETEPVAGAETPEETSMPEETPTTTTTEAPVVGDDDVKQLTERILAEMGGTAKITDPVVQQFVEKAARELAEARSVAAQAKEQALTLSQQNAVLQAQNRVKTFTDEVMGNGPHSGIRYAGEIADHVRMLCSLANTYGDQSWEVEHYKKTNRSLAEQIKAGSLFKEIGTGRGGGDALTAEDQINALAREMTKANPALSHAQAFMQVLDNNTELRTAHARERRG